MEAWEEDERERLEKKSLKKAEVNLPGCMHLLFTFPTLPMEAKTIIKATGGKKVKKVGEVSQRSL